MADLRVLKLALLAETKDFINGLDKATKESKTFSQNLGSALKIGAAAFVALGAAAATAAIKIGKDAVEAAIADQKSQVLLADALKNTTGATDAQIKATEDFIRKTQLAAGVSDSQLRPALGNLVRATGNATKAQELLTLALDISVATGKDVESVSLALSKAYNGNIGALTRLGVPLDENIIKSKDFEAATDELQKLFGGSASAAADTYAGKLAIIQERLGEAQESLGEALLPILERISKFIVETVVPAFEGLVRGLTGGDRSVKGATKETNSAFGELGIVFDENDDAAYLLGSAIRDLTETLGNLFGTVDAGTGEDSGFVRFIGFIEKVVRALDSLIKKAEEAAEKVRDAIDVIGLQGPLTSVEAAGERFRSSLPNVPSAGRARVPQINVNVTGAIDPQGTARTVVRTLNTAQRTTGAGLSRLTR